LRAKYKSVQLIENQENAGFGRANNQALPWMACAGGDVEALTAIEVCLDKTEAELTVMGEDRGERLINPHQVQEAAC
jgi:GT2 family glycosyltransferase